MAEISRYDSSAMVDKLVLSAIKEKVRELIKNDLDQYVDQVVAAIAEKAEFSVKSFLNRSMDSFEEEMRVSIKVEDKRQK